MMTYLECLAVLGIPFLFAAFLVAVSALAGLI